MLEVFEMDFYACDHCAFRDDQGGGLFNCECPTKQKDKCYYSKKMSNQVWLSYHASILRKDRQMELFTSNVVNQALAR